MALKAKKQADTPKKGVEEVPEKQPDEDITQRLSEEDKSVIDLSSLGITPKDDATDTGAGSESVELVDLEVDGKKVKVSKDARDALASFVTRSVSSSRPVEKEQDEEPSRKKTTQEDDFYASADKDLFIRPTEFLKAFAGRIREEVIQTVRGEYNSDQGQKKFWNDFYSDNKDLSNHRDLVNTVLAKNKDELAPMKVAEASKRLADLTRTTVLDIVKQFGGDPKLSQGRDRVEGATAVSTKKGSAKDKEDVPSSLSATIKARQSARRAARLQSLN